MRQRPEERIPYQDKEISVIHIHTQDTRCDTPSNATPGYAHIPKQRLLDINMASEDVGHFCAGVWVILL